MKKLFKKILILLSIIALGILIYIIGILLINTFNNYKAETRSLLSKVPQGDALATDINSFSMVSWNIGYGGLGQKMDFFYDGGEMVRPTHDLYLQDFDKILQLISTFDTLDFIMLQEVDTCSKRSYQSNQYQEISSLLPAFSSLFIKNYDVVHVPVPPLRPMGQVISGLAAFSDYPFSSADQIALPGDYSWPTSLFMPDRCFISTSITLENGKRLYLINTHLSAFDDGNMRADQLEFMRNYLYGIYKNGDYVVAGGDWNINPPAYENKPFSSGDISFIEAPSIGFNWFEEGWNIVYDPAFPTNRKLESAYVNSETPTTILDYYICSPNINILEIKNFYRGFKHSDHNPVYIRFALK